MTRINRAYMLTVLLFVLITIAGCARYERKVVPFKMPEAYINATEVAGATIAAKAYTREEAKVAFGFDMVGSGVLPVQVIFDNRGKHPLEIVAGRTYLVDIQNNLWPVLNQEIAYDRIAKESEFGEILPEGAKSGLLAGAAGAVIGAAIGIVTGTSIGEAAGKGAAIGAAAGLTIGGAKGLEGTKAPHQIGEDLHRRSLEDRPVPPDDISHGFIFFPGEAKEQAKELRLTIREVDTGVAHSLIMKF
ncbi:MAG: glycine zipper family protein [Thermodesulfobacteriota bacterium]|nr:glycine zipper family protein [Thermodesulfobacteriota bacterium]